MPGSGTAPQTRHPLHHGSLQHLWIGRHPADHCCSRPGQTTCSSSVGDRSRVTTSVSTERAHKPFARLKQRGLPSACVPIFSA
jgi:hypothetical protein